MNTYLHALQGRLGYRGDITKGEIAIDEARAGDQGFGIVYENPYIKLINDPVIFPNGVRGAYVRILNQHESQGTGGAVVVPLFDGKTVFVRLFRHPTRAWETELPRGFQDPGISDEANVRKEVREELGVEAVAIHRLGEISPNTGLLASAIGVFVAELAALPDRDVNQADVEVHSRQIVPLSDLDHFVINTPIRCSISLAAIYMARLRGYL